MKPIIVSYGCADHDPIDEWIPDDPSDVDFWMNFIIGPSKAAGDNFQVRIVTANNLDGKQSAKHAIVMGSYSWASALAAVKNLLENCQGTDWSEIAEKLSKQMYWEFDNYRPYSGD